MFLENIYCFNVTFHFKLQRTQIFFLIIFLKFICCSYILPNRIFSQTIVILLISANAT